MKRLKICILLLMMTLCLFGCTNSKSNQKETTIENSSQEIGQPQNQEPPKEEFKENGFMGRVKEVDVDNNKLTITTMNKGMALDSSRSGQPEFDQNNKPENMPEKNDGEKPDNKPETNQDFDPSNAPDAMAGPSNEETSLSYNVTEETVIKNSNDEIIAIADLKIDDFISYTVDGENLLNVTVVTMDNIPEQPKQ